MSPALRELNAIQLSSNVLQQIQTKQYLNILEAFVVNTEGLTGENLIFNLSGDLILWFNEKKKISLLPAFSGQKNRLTAAL